MNPLIPKAEAWAPRLLAQALPGTGRGDFQSDSVTAADITVGAMLSMLFFLLVCFGIWAWRIHQRRANNSALHNLDEAIAPPTPQPPARPGWEKPEDWWREDP